ncbi:MAG: hypothetical protein AAFR59_04410 [Bacteroidota bacterium]
MKQVHGNLGLVDSETIRYKLILFRAFYVSVATFLVGAGHLINLVAPEQATLLWDRYLFSAVLLSTLVFSFIPKISYSLIRKVTFFEVYLTIVHGFWLVYNGSGSPYYFILTLGACVFFSLFAEDTKHLIYFLILSWLSMFVFLILLPDSQTLYYYLFVCFFFTGISSFTYFVGFTRINGLQTIYQQQDKISQQNSLLKSIVEGTDGLIFSLDIDQHFISFNSLCADLIRKITTNKHQIQQGERADLVLDNMLDADF